MKERSLGGHLCQEQECGLTNEDLGELVGELVEELVDFASPPVIFAVVLAVINHSEELVLVVP